MAEKKKSKKKINSREETFVASGQIEVITKLADGFVHEMNNVLSTIIGLTSVLETEIAPESPSFEDVRGIMSAARRGLNVTRSLRGFVQPDVKDNDVISLNHTVGMVTGLLQRSISNKIKIETQLSNDVYNVAGNPNKIKQIIINLVMNAVDAIAQRGTITIATSNVEIIEDRTTPNPELLPGKYVQLQVSDTGRGMDASTIAQAFEPLFTTKPAGAAGLGLTLVLNSAKQHGGHVSIFSKPNMGTTVSVYLAASERPIALSNPPVDAHQDKRKRSRTVLVVDDDQLVLTTSTRLLEKLGYNVIASRDGKTALALYKKRYKDIALVMLDLIMPEMDGAEVAKQLKKINPKARIVIVSGYEQEQSFNEILDLGAAAFVQKPFNLNGLASILDEAIDGS